LQGIFVSVQLTQYCAEIEMCVCQCLRLIQFELEVQCLDEIGKGSTDFPSAAIVAGEVIEGSGLEDQ
jgi:hypothetical protein